MEKEYQKIGNVFKFDEKFRTIIGLNEQYETLKNIVWEGTEKLDGSGHRIYWDGHRISFFGRTNKSEIPGHIKEYLESIFLTQEMEYVFKQIFEEKEVYIFGECIGHKVQKDGDKYLPDNKIGFVIFDINVDGYDLTRDSVNDIADRLGLPSVPVVFHGTLDEAKQYVSEHHMSTLNNGLHEMEGLVLQPSGIQLYDRNHHLIKCKCKYRDMLKGGLLK